MPSGKVHAKCSLYLAVPAAGLGAVGGYAVSGSPLVAAISGGCCALGCLLGVPLTPDLDQESISTVEYQIIKWTLGLGFLWTMVWFPYALLTAHRGNLSHFPFIGTLGRLLYVSLWVGLCVFFGMKLPHVPLTYLLWGVVGLVISDIAHWALDVKFGDPWDQKRRRANGKGRKD